MMQAQINARLEKGFSKADAAPRVMKIVAPGLPWGVTADQRQGTVVAELNVADDGHVSMVKILESPNSKLSDTVTEALSQWVFSPLVVNGKATSFKVHQSFDFALK